MRSNYGHDAFLVEFDEQTTCTNIFLRRCMMSVAADDLKNGKVRIDTGDPRDDRTGASVLDLGCGTGSFSLFS